MRKRLNSDRTCWLGRQRSEPSTLLRSCFAGTGAKPPATVLFLLQPRLAGACNPASLLPHWDSVLHALCSTNYKMQSARIVSQGSISLLSGRKTARWLSQASDGFSLTCFHWGKRCRKNSFPLISVHDILRCIPSGHLQLLWKAAL